ncbi:hypothetical protein [Mesorhizobium sp. M0586]
MLLVRDAEDRPWRIWLDSFVMLAQRGLAAVEGASRHPMRGEDIDIARE